MDYERLARELVRALRGRRSQRAFSGQLGYRTNVVYAWEAGRRFPTAAEAFRAAARAKVEVGAAVARFRREPAEHVDLSTPAGVAAFLREMAGNTHRTELARRAGASRHAVGRWLSGAAQPRLPDFLRLVDAESLRVLDFVAALVDPARVPSIAREWSDLAARRALARDLPWSQAVLRVLEIADYRALPAHRPGWIANRLGIPAPEEARCLEALEAAGQVAWDGRRYRPDAVVTVDTRPSPEAGRRMRRHWCEVAVARIEGERPGLYSYNVFAVSRADLERLRELHLAYFRELRAVVAESSPSEVVAVANVQLFEVG